MAKDLNQTVGFIIPTGVFPADLENNIQGRYFIQIGDQAFVCVSLVCKKKKIPVKLMVSSAACFILQSKEKLDPSLRLLKNSFPRSTAFGLMRYRDSEDFFDIMQGDNDTEAHDRYHRVNAMIKYLLSSTESA